MTYLEAVDRSEVPVVLDVELAVDDGDRVQRDVDQGVVVRVGSPPDAQPHTHAPADGCRCEIGHDIAIEAQAFMRIQ